MAWAYPRSGRAPHAIAAPRRRRFGSGQATPPDGRHRLSDTRRAPHEFSRFDGGTAAASIRIMESTRQRAPTPTIEAPTAAAPASSAEFGSNAGRQEALVAAARAGNRATADEQAAAGNVATSGNLAAETNLPAGENLAAAAEGESPLAELVRVLGDAASVVFDSLPFQEVAPQLPPLLGVPWVREWVRGVPAEELLGLREAVAAPLLAEAIPVGVRIRATVEARLALAFGAMVGGELELERTREGLVVRLDGRFMGTFGVGEGAALLGADASAQAAVSGTAEAGVAGNAEWRVPGTVPAGLARYLLASLHGSPAGTDELERWLAAAPPTRWAVGVTAGSEASAGADGVGPGWIRGARLGVDLLGRGELLVGMDEGAPYERATWRSEAGGRAGEAALAQTGAIVLEVWGADGVQPSSPSRVRLSMATRLGGDALRDVVDVPSLDEALGLVHAALDEEAEAPVGTLRIDREHTIDDPDAVRDLVGPALDGGVAADLFFAKAEVQRSARVSVVVDESLPAVPGIDAADPEQRRDQQRAVAAVVLGEVYESPLIDPAGFLDHAAVDEVSVEWAQRGALGAGLCAAQVAEANGLVRDSVTVAHREDLTGSVDVADVARLLRA